MRVLIVTSVRNEAPFLLEWIAHHQGAGITDFLIYSNDCDDGTEDILQALDRAGVITHIPQTIPPDTSPQWQAFRAAWSHPLRKSADWALVLDTDEFLNIHLEPRTVQNVITNCEGADAIAIGWRLFGANGQAKFRDAPTTETFTASSSADCAYPIAATFFKTLFRTRGPFNQFGVHRPKQKRADKGLPHWVDGSGQPLHNVIAENPNRLSLYGTGAGRKMVELNHYSLRSAESFLAKRARGLPNRSQKSIDLTYWVERNFNTAANTTIAPMRPATEAALARLMALPHMPALQAAGVAHHRATIAAALQDPDQPC